MGGQLTWYVARAAGIVTWGLLIASMIWGLLYATRVLRRRVSAWWLLGVHRFLGALAVVFAGVHVVALLADQLRQLPACATCSCRSSDPGIRSRSDGA